MRRQWREWWPAIVVVVAAAVTIVCVMGSSSGASLRRSPRRAGFGAVRDLVDHGTVDGVVLGSTGLDVALERDDDAGSDWLERLSLTGGRTLARRDLGQHLDGGLDVDGSLWLVTTAVDGRRVTDTLWRLDPLTLTVRSRANLPGDTAFGASDEPLAVVGRRLWLAYGDRLVQVDPRTAALGVPVRVAGAKELDIQSARHGRTLLLSAGDGSGRGWIQERDPVSGAVRQTSRRYLGVAFPRLGGATHTRLWITEATGTEGYGEAVSLRTLRPLPSPAALRGASNGIEIHVFGGVLVVSDDGGGVSRNYCGDPATGAARVTLPRSVRRGRVLAVGAGRIVYLGPPTRRSPPGPLLTVTLPATCN